MEKVNVLHVIDHMGIGGAQRIVSELLSKWNEENIKLFCYALRVSKNNFDHSNKQAFYSSNHKSKYDITSFFELKNIIEQKDIKILHLHLAKSIIFGVLLKMFYFKDIKIIVHEHGRIYQNNFWYNYFLKVFQDKIDLFIAVSEATKKLLISAKINENKMDILYNFIDLTDFNSDYIENYDKTIEKRKVGIKKEDFVIGFAGRLDKIKGCDILIRSIPYINSQNFKILVAGDGSERKQLEKLSKYLNIKDRIIFLGYVNNMKKFYSKIDCLVIPSRSESFGLSAVEAQALGISVIASNINGLNEVVLDKKTGLLFKPGNEKDLAKKIDLIYKNTDLKCCLVKNGLENVQKFSLDGYLLNLQKMYVNKSTDIKLE